MSTDRARKWAVRAQNKAAGATWSFLPPKEGVVSSSGLLNLGDLTSLSERMHRQVEQDACGIVRRSELADGRLPIWAGQVSKVGVQAVASSAGAVQGWHRTLLEALPSDERVAPAPGALLPVAGMAPYSNLLAIDRGCDHAQDVRSP